MRKFVWLLFLTISTDALLSNWLVAEEVALKEFYISASFPTEDDWRILLDGPVKGVEGTYAYAVANQRATKQLTLMALPTADEKKTLEAAFDSLEKGFLKKATRRISSSKSTVSGHSARKVIAAVKLDDGSEVQILGIFAIANGLTYSISATSKEPVDADADIMRFLESVRRTDREITSVISS